MGKLDLWICTICEYLYDPLIGDLDNGIDSGTAFTDLPENWICPGCGMEKDLFVPYLEHAEYGISEEIEA